MVAIDPRINVPVIIDAVKGSGQNALVRSVYLTIEFAGPSSDWSLHLGKTVAPFIMLGLSGIIHKPLSGKIFNSLKRITDLVETIETNTDLFIDTNGVWLPKNIFTETPGSSDVWRVPFKSFRHGLMYSEGSMDEDTFFTSLSDNGEFMAQHSKKETEAFDLWERSVIEDAKQSYYKNQDMALKWKKPEGEE
jgi:hypothetical protein